MLEKLRSDSFVSRSGRSHDGSIGVAEDTFHPSEGLCLKFGGNARGALLVYIHDSSEFDRRILSEGPNVISAESATDCRVDIYRCKVLLRSLRVKTGVAGIQRQVVSDP